uniref:NAD(P)-binding protein n=1 Tax=Rhabditophanes sp. KR3021 TaxID=114890 RepID=A0AC35UCD7_9BILA
MHSLYVILYIYWIGFYYSVTELLHDFLSPKVDLKGYLVNNTDVPLICVLTGGEGTIGRKICSQLLDLGFEIYSLLPQTDSQIKKGNNLLFGNNHPRIHYVSCDLSNLQSVKKACNKLNSQLSHIDILICNAGIMCATDNRTASMNDLNIYEPHVSVNLLGHAAITHSLRSLILQSPNGRTSRILYVSSSTAHAGIVPSKDDILKGTFLKHYDSGYQAYANSKLWLIMYGKYLTSQYYHKLDNTNLDKVNGKMLEVGSLHPGVIPGALYRNVLPLFRYIICNILNVFLR